MRAETSCRGIDVIVPVYRDLAATKRCVESVLNSDQGLRKNLIIINDASPEPDVVAYCKSLKNRPGVTVLHNKENKGFVATVNIGMQLNTAYDSVLLNSDAEVAGDWLVRLQACAYREPHTATVTPFSNNATICSYPNFLESNELPEDYGVARLHALFSQVNDSKQLLIPTAVGFCMYIRRDCINEIGYFDEVNFGKGYGEECDFSMRVAAAGWHNQMAADVFVFHEGGVSFGEETQQRKVAAEKVMARKHPSYGDEVTQFIAQDPVAKYRDAVNAVRIKASEKEITVAVCLAVCNGMRWLPELLASILGQKGVRVAIFISVDSSNDGSAEWARQQAAIYNNVELLPIGAHQPSASQNFFRLCRDIDFGEFDYMCLADQDDVWLSDRLSRAVVILRKTGCVGYSSNVIATWESTGETTFINKTQPQVSWDHLFEAPGPGCTFVLTQSFALQLQQFLKETQQQTKMITAHDWLIYAYARVQRYQWHIDPQASLLYRQHDANTLGANQGLQAWRRRWESIRDHSWLKQITYTMEILGINNQPFVRQWYPFSHGGFLKLGIHAKHCRRRRRDKLAFAVIAFYWSITERSKPQK